MRLPSQSVQFSFRQTPFGAILVVRHAVPGHLPGDWCWSRWRRATRDEIDVALIQVRLLNYPKSETACRSCGCRSECDPHVS
jgi:hypothetical protein